MNATESKTYNGWTNYETWDVKLWLDNDYGLYSMIQEQADRIRGELKERATCSECLARTYRDEECVCPGDAGDAEVFDEIFGEGRRELADYIESLVQEMAPELEASMFSDLLTNAIGRVEWFEIAENILGED
jgi:hypothetical protein